MNTFKCVLHATFFITLLLAPYTAANAELFTYTFTGVIETVDSGLASEVSPSQPIYGSFTYESTTPGTGDYNGAITEATCKIGTLPAVTTDISQGIFIENDRIISVGDLPRDNIVFSPIYFNKLSVNGFDLRFCAMVLTDFTGTAFGNTDLPDPPDRTLNLDDFQVTNVVAIFVLDDPYFPFPQSAVIRGKLTSLEIDGTSPNSAPNADAGTNIIIDSVEQSITTLLGTASDIDADQLTYRWLEDTNVLQDYAPVGTNGEAHLVMDDVPLLGTGEHTLVLEVDDGTTTAISVMILTINNSPPNVSITCGPGTYQLGEIIQLCGEVSDYDGDNLNYSWAEGATNINSGFTVTNLSGTPVNLPEHYIIGGLSLGSHIVTLSAVDTLGSGSTASANILINVIDDEAPTLQPLVSPGILWPPNHKMVDVVVHANATDNSGSVILSATVVSSEPAETDGDGNTIPNYTIPVIDQSTSEITLQLRSERKGKGAGRTYTITVTATDSSGNSSDAIVEVVAPHDKGKK